MKISLNTRLSGLILIFVLLISSNSVFSQTGGSGRDFWFSLPHCMRSSNEMIRWGQYAIQLWIFSEQETTLSVTSADGSLPINNYTVPAYECKIISIPDNLECDTSEVVLQNGIHVTAADPVKLTVFTAYKWTGEAYNVIPVEYLGTDYYTLNLYQDHTKMAAGYTEYKPAQILITATEDGTELYYSPSVETQGGIKAGETKNISMDEGESFLILSKIVPGLNHYDETDLTGTHIYSNKPIFVQSGHTKGAYPRYPVIFLGSLKSDFMRNMLVEAMPPVPNLGLEYVSAPIMYLDRDNYGTIDNDRGDLIRIVATKDYTDIYSTDASGKLELKWQGLMAGDWREIPSQEYPAYYSANHSILIGQYGKSWWSQAVEVEKEGDNPQNPPRNGQGMMMVLTPVKNWVSSASFYSASDMNNFFYITFRTDDYNQIELDSQSLQSIYGSEKLNEISGTEFSYIAGALGPGSHIIEGSNSAKFAAYVYGNWDLAKDGFAYGYPIGFDLDITSINESRNSEYPANNIKISPNPVNNNAYIEFNSSSAKKAELKLINSLGQEVYGQKIEINQGNNALSVKLPDALPKGAYILIIDTSSGQLSSKLVIE